MWGLDPRSLMLAAACLDFAGQLILLWLIAVLSNWLALPFLLEGQAVAFPVGWTLFCLLVYPCLGWLFGSFTLLRWRSLHLHVLIQRLFLTAVAALIVVAVARWLINPPDSIWVLHRRVQLLWLGSLFTWSLLVRFGLRRGLVFPEPPQLLLLADNSEADIIQRAWKRVPQLSGLRRVINA